MRKYLFSIVCAALSVICFTAYNVIGSKVLEDGRLVEPFYLIPIGFGLMLIAVISFIVVFLSVKFLGNKIEGTK